VLNIDIIDINSHGGLTVLRFWPV